MSVNEQNLNQKPSGFGPRWAFRLLILVLVGVASWQIYEYGRRMAGFDRFDAADREAALQGEIDKLEVLNSDLRAQVARLETSANIDKQAYAQIDGSLGELQDEIQNQQEELAFYRSIVAPADGKSGLKVQEFHLAKRGGADSYSLGLVVIRTKKHDSRVTGRVHVTVEGLKDGKPTTIKLADLTPEGSEVLPLEFKFRYFQDFERDIVLPTDFTPQKVLVELSPSSKWIKPVSQSFDWRVSNS